jgi:hypothetical protein
MIDFVLGRRGHGKTTLGYFVASRAARTLIWDPRGGIRHRDERPHSAVAVNEQELRRGVNYLLTGDLTEVIFTPPDPPARMFAAFAREGLRLMRNAPRGLKVSVLIDEIRSIDTSDVYLDSMLRYTDINQFRVIFTGHRPKDVPTDIRAIGNRWLLFRFTLPRDLDVLDEHTTPEVAKRVRTLAPREFVCWDDAKDGYELFKDPSTWFVVLGPETAEAPQYDDDDFVGEDESIDNGLPFGKQ